MDKRTDEPWRIAMSIHRGELSNKLAAERIEEYAQKCAKEAVGSQRPEPITGTFDCFLTVLHACIERWSLATEQGRVPGSQPVQNDPDYIRGCTLLSGPFAGQQPGSPVEIFPPGWETVTDKKSGLTAKVTPNQAKQIRKLFEEADERDRKQKRGFDGFRIQDE